MQYISVKIYCQLLGKRVENIHRRTFNNRKMYRQTTRCAQT